MTHRTGLLPGGKIIAGTLALIAGLIGAAAIVPSTPTPAEVETTAPIIVETIREVGEPDEIVENAGRAIGAPADDAAARTAGEPSDGSAPGALAFVDDDDTEPASIPADSVDETISDHAEASPSAPSSAGSATTVAPATTARPTTAPPTTAAATTASPSTTPPTTRPASPSARRASNGAPYLAASAPTDIPVYDTAWQMLVRGTPTQTNEYFATLKDYGFSGAWAGIIHHAPATWNANFAGGGRVGNMVNGEIVLTPEYVAHVRSILDTADRHGMQVGLVAAWQNLYLPGGGADAGIPTSDQVRGSITTANAYAYGRQIAGAFGDHPGVSMWVFGGDAGTNNTEANKAVWREMARGVRDAGNSLEITYHTPTSEFDQLNYAGEPWLDFIAPETGHAQDAGTTEAELRTAAAAYKLPVWQGEPRYFNINFDWVNAAFRNPGVNQVRADAQAAADAGVAGYVYGDAGRWTWCAGYGDSTPCSASNIAASFGDGERAVIAVFS